ncbi:hypothetical protein [uncultured Thiodictyon sp.]|uniref:hypothetical protein n=1 Tax=uncultured Thiodictyon sp. TaxID=1846217 RepID=UPI0025EA4D53|nr:hypothetical protein [uncultured Thiodictyon sp.]
MLLFTSLILAWMAARLLLAALFAGQTQTFLDDWFAQGGAPSPPAWEVARQAATSAIALFPAANGAYQERLGLVHSWRYRGRPFGDLLAAPSRQAALAAYRAAVAATPLWPRAWTQIAYAKLDLGERDAGFRASLHQAHALGPWRPDINRRIVEIGLIAWGSLDVTTRALTLESARRVAAGSAEDAHWLLGLAKGRGMTLVVCVALPDEIKRMHRICGS